MTSDSAAGSPPDEWTPADRHPEGSAPPRPDESPSLVRPDEPPSLVSRPGPVPASGPTFSPEEAAALAASIAQAAARPAAPARPVTPSTRSIFETAVEAPDPTPDVATPPPLPVPPPPAAAAAALAVVPVVATPPPLPVPDLAPPPPLPVPGSSVHAAPAEAAEARTSLASPTDPDLDEAEPAMDDVEPHRDRPGDPAPTADADGAWSPPIVPITRPTPLPVLAPVEPEATPAAVPSRVSAPPLPEAPPPAAGPGRFADGRFADGRFAPAEAPPTQTVPGTPPVVYPPAAGYGFPVTADPSAAASGGWSGLAITAFVLSLLAFGPISLVLAILALRRIRRTGERGRGLAVAATILSALGVLSWAAVVAVSVFAVNQVQVTRDGQGVVNRAGVISAGQLEVGDCLATWDVGVVSTVGVTPCAEPHRAQVFTERVLPSGAYPGEQAVIASADRLCTDQAAGRNWDGLPGDARVSYLYPRSDGWASGDRQVTCLVVTSAPVTGSAPGVDGAAAATPSS